MELKSSLFQIESSLSKLQSSIIQIKISLIGYVLFFILCCIEIESSLIE